jgi:hypothetical protein
LSVSPCACLLFCPLCPFSISFIFYFLDSS